MKSPCDTCREPTGRCQRGKKCGIYKEWWHRYYERFWPNEEEIRNAQRLLEIKRMQKESARYLMQLYHEMMPWAKENPSEESEG